MLGMRRRVEQFPTQLPFARLYLDDLEEIIGIFREAITKRFRDESATWNEPDREGQFEITVLYRTGNEEMDSVADLQEHGGSLADLTVTMQGEHTGGRFFRATCSLNLQGFLSDAPSVSLGIGDEIWGTYARVKAVFERRRMALRTLVGDLPFSVKLGAWAFTLVPLAIGIGLRSSSHAAAANVIDIIAAAYSLLFLCGLAVSFRSSRVYLMRSREKWRVAADARRKSAYGAVIFLIGVVVTELVHYLFSRWTGTTTPPAH